MLKQEDYFKEAEERLCDTVCLSDLPRMSVEARTIIENAYRRGFYQGAMAAYESVISGFYPGQLLNWLNRLFTWRYKKHNGKFVKPEWLARCKDPKTAIGVKR